MLQRATSFGSTRFKTESKETGKTKECPVFGIDLGTTNSAISVIAQGKEPHTISLKNSKLTMPSCVLYHHGKFIVGQEAYNHRYSSSAVYSVKRLMQTPNAKVKVFDEGREYEFTPAEISAEILKGLVAETGGMYGDIKDVVVTVPAYFDQNGVNATREACELAGLNLIGIANEPTAASLCYELKPEDGDSKDVLVYDLGGGTFDVTIIRIQDMQSKNTFEDIYGSDSESDDNANKAVSTLGISGDTHLGGDDYDKALLKILMLNLRDQGIDPTKFTREYKEKLLLRLERYKKGDPMSVYQVDIDTVDIDGKSCKATVTLTQNDFKKAADIIFEKTRVIVDKLLSDTENKVDTIVLTGGSTKCYWIKEAIKAYYSKYQINDALSPDLSVSQGAAIQGYATKFGDSGVQIFDILPLTIGILAEDRVKSFIPKSTSLPVIKTMQFTTDRDNQTCVAVRLYQGNSKVPEECATLGVIEISGIKEQPAGQPILKVTISITADRLMKCTASIDGIEKVITLNLSGETSNNSSSGATSKEERVLSMLEKASRTMQEDKAAQFLNMIEDFRRGENGITLDVLKDYVRDNRVKTVNED